MSVPALPLGGAGVAALDSTEIWRARLASVAEAVLIPLAALTIAGLIFGVFIAVAGQDPLEVYATIFRGAFGSWFSWQNSLLRAAPIMLTALCTAIPARAGLVIIGAEGAVVLGGLCAALTGITLNGLPPMLVIFAMLVAGMVMGGLWIGAAGALKHYRGVNETISSLLLNYIAIAVLNFLIFGMLKDPSTLNKPSSYPIGDENLIGVIGESSIHWGLAFGLALCVLYWLIARRTPFGFALDIVGGNVRAAQVCGLPVGRLIVIACLLGGAAAGLAGAIEVAAVHGRANSSLNAGYGYAGILVAFMARQNPLAIIPVAILLGGIRASSGVLQRAHDLPDATVLVLQGIVFVAILASEMFYGRFQWFKLAKARS